MKKREILSDHFFRDEFACQGLDCCGHSAPIDAKIIEGLEKFRFLLSKIEGEEIAVKITSGFRCKKHNEQIGGSKDSYHTKGLAVDIQTKASVQNMLEAASQIRLFKYGGIGIYKNRLHLDLGLMRRWKDLK